MNVRDPSSAVKPTVFYGRIIHSLSLTKLEILHCAALGVDSNGCIAFVDKEVLSAEEACTKYDGFKDASEVVLKPLQFLFPGLIDTHLHAPQYPNLAIGMEGTLREWVENYTDPIEASYSDISKAKRVYDEMVRKELDLGSTTVAYNSSTHVEATNVLADSCLKYGQRAVIGKLCILLNSTHGNWEGSVEESLEGERKCVEYIRSIDPEGKLLSPCVQPRGGPYLPPEGMKGLGEICREYGDGGLLHVQAHMCETLEDIERTKKVQGEFETMSEMYKSYGLMHQKSILAHCIHLTERDMDVMLETGVGVAHNPNSNTCLRDGECPVRELLRKGVKVGLGTDCSAGYSTFMLDSMRQASNVSSHRVMHKKDENLRLGFEEIVFLGTLGSAQVVGMEEKIGNFLVGKCFDALVVDVGLDDCINVSGWERDDLSLVKKWVFMGDDRSIRLVYVGGKLVAGKDAGEEV
jgi:guanine deaminase